MVDTLFPKSKEMIGYDLTQEVGIAGNFLGEEHTVEYMRESYWISEIFNRDDWSNWVQKGKRDVYDRAHEFVERVIAGYRNMEPIISQSLCDDLDKIAKEAQTEIAARG